MPNLTCRRLKPIWLKSTAWQLWKPRWPIRTLTQKLISLFWRKYILSFREVEIGVLEVLIWPHCGKGVVFGLRGFWFVGKFEVGNAEAPQIFIIYLCTFLSYGCLIWPHLAELFWKDSYAHEINFEGAERYKPFPTCLLLHHHHHFLRRPILQNPIGNIWFYFLPVS